MVKRTPKATTPKPKRGTSYAAQWDAQAAQQRTELEAYAQDWNRTARTAGNTKA